MRGGTGFRVKSGNRSEQGVFGYIFSFQGRFFTIVKRKGESFGLET